MVLFMIWRLMIGMRYIDNAQDLAVLIVALFFWELIGVLEIGEMLG